MGDEKLEIRFPSAHGDVIAQFDAEDVGRFPPGIWRGHKYRKFFYIRRSGTDELAHRILMGCVPGDGIVVDHIDGDSLNNRRSNLRVVTAKQNQWNRRATSSTGYIGVTKHNSGNFVGVVRQDGQYYYCGFHRSAEAAALAVNAKLFELRGEFARLNVLPTCS